jgi:DNA-binding NarL/FixJ family response regulator
MIRVLIADDHAIVRAGLKQIFGLLPEIAIAGEVENAEQTLASLQRRDFDLLLMDLNMPGASGVELVAKVRARRSDLPILVLTIHDEPQIAASVLRAGANGFITKDCDLGVLLPAIQAVAAHGNYLSPGIAAKIVFREVPPTGSAPHLTLTPRETEVLRYLIQGVGINAIAARLALSNKTVSTHKLRLLKKLACSNVAELMRYAVRHDLLN